MGKFSDLINSMITTALRSSYIVSPRFDDYEIRDVEVTTDPDFENEIKKLINESSGSKSGPTQDVDSKKSDKQLLENTKQLKLLDKSNMGEINRLTSTQFGNIREIATNPTGFVTKAFLRKFAKGAGVIALALIIFEAVKWVISELLKPGRMLDIRFKRDINNEIIAFRRREEQQKIKQGLSNIIITTMPRLRGGQGQVTNTLNMAAGREKIPDNFGMAPLLYQASGPDLSKGNGRRFH